ncbi:hypothetical protein RCL1_002968 [Eukaryota sp. TZLM3-RCL]
MYFINVPIVNSDLRPDILLINSQEVIISELTCPMESSLIEKTAKCQQLASSYTAQSLNVSFYVFEVSASGLNTDSVSIFPQKLLVPTKAVKKYVRNIHLQL